MAILDHTPTPEDTPEDSDEQPQLKETPADHTHIYPLHAITNTSICEMMRLRGTIEHLPINIFIDCGSTMNFFNPTVVHKLGLPVSPPTSLQFTTTFGHTLSPSCQAHNVTVHIQDYSFTSYFLLFPVVGCDLVLGAQ